MTVPEATREATKETTVQATFCATLVDEWVRAGATEAVVCPGSRSAPLALALAARPELQLHVRLDERGAGFFALGLALATGRPAVVCVTSGTAAAELLPAVVEAHHARVPVLVCTADRPPELQGVGAPQTIDQGGLYGRAVRWAATPGVADATQQGSWRSLASRAFAEATAGPFGPGPVHLNLAFREPLVAEPGPLPAGPAGGAPAHRVTVSGAPPAPDPATWPSGRGILVAGEGCGPPDLVLAAARHLGWPLLADPRSGCRVGDPHVVAAADALVRTNFARRHLRPEVVVRLGSAWASKALGGFLGGSGDPISAPYTVAVDPWWRWEDPDRVSAERWRGDPAAWLAGVLAVEPPATPAGWQAVWARAEAAAQAAIEEVLADDLSEPAVARRLLGWLPAGVTVVVASSMPVRDLEWYAPALEGPPRVVANRGANGIDGVVSTALGVAAAGGPVVCLLGDLAFLHDASGLVRLAGSTEGDCTLVVVDNGGGAIFDFLPQRGLERARFERLFGTPPATDVAAVARGMGVAVHEADTLEALAGALGATVGVPGTAAVRVRVPDRQANVALHGALMAAVDSALQRL